MIECVRIRFFTLQHVTMLEETWVNVRIQWHTAGWLSFKPSNNEPDVLHLYCGYVFALLVCSLGVVMLSRLRLHVGKTCERRMGIWLYGNVGACNIICVDFPLHNYLPLLRLQFLTPS